MKYKRVDGTSVKCGVTLNSLREQQYALNWQMLLAVQQDDNKMQEILKVRLAELQTKIDRMALRR
ncbi:MAG: hypothetical protein HFF61_00725 [Oscillospiraceae bacterium]|nr:hypothetical protein [Oscillospiraceae bacterium]